MFVIFNTNFNIIIVEIIKEMIYFQEFIHTFRLILYDFEVEYNITEGKQSF